ncbi:MAG: peptidoglycan DD-metalloendopeptidase family protein [Bacteroidetes bacterium]|nr:peptidoglycan DD-metalloendopeptidase family protein [Bacteroidota bacterium]
MFYKTAYLLLLVFFLNINVMFSQNSKEKLQVKKKKIENDIAYSDKLLYQTKKNKQISLNQLIILNNKINQREELVSSINNEIHNIDYKINNNSEEISKLSAEIKRYKADYAKMIYWAYKNRNSFSRLLFIFASDDLNQAFLRLKYLQQYINYRRKQSELIVKTSKLLNIKLTELINTKINKSTVLTSKEAEKLLLAKEKDEKNAAVKKLQQKEKELIKTIKQKEKESKKLQQSIENLIAAEIKKVSRNNLTINSVTPKKTSKTSNISKELGLTETDQILSNSFTLNKGKLTWPTENGVVTGTFGEHPHPVLSGIKVKNNGIDISTDNGAKARAVFNGKVTGVISIPGANKVAIIRHGEYLTVYSNLKDLYVKTGDIVKTKQNIGLIYTDVAESKTELHFEVWFGKTLSNPLIWLLPSKK